MRAFCLILDHCAASSPAIARVTEKQETTQTLLSPSAMWFALLATVVAAVLAGWWWFFRPLGLWRRRGVPFEPAKPIVGNFWDVLLQRCNGGELLANIYRKHVGKPYVGVFQFSTPALMLRDPELVRCVLTKDFAHFRDNSFPVDEKMDPLLAKNPFVLKGDKWKASRAQLTPAFSSGRIRSTLPLLAECAHQLVDFVRKEAPGSLPDGLNVKELAARYTTEAVSSVAFALKANCFEEQNPEIRRMNRKILEPTPLSTLQFTLALLFPKLAQLIRVRILPSDVDTYFRRLVKDAVAYRERTGFERADFLQMLLQLKHKSQENGDGAYGDEEMTAHALSFFVDGFETSSVALAFMLHDLASEPQAQHRLREELRALPLGDYEAVLRAPYLDACLQETLRLHPPGMFLHKICTAAWRPPVLAEGAKPGPVLHEGDFLLIPLLALHTDEAHHPQALRWRPERWMPEEDEAPPPRFASIPFGEGPRQCLGMRFAQAQVKVGAAELIRAFEVKLTARSPSNPPPLDPVNLFYGAKGGLWLRFDPLPH